MTFFEPFFYAMMILMFILAIVIYLKNKKLNSLIYLLSAFSYVITIAYIIDFFELQKNGIMFILSFSALLMMGIGLFMRKIKLKKKDKVSSWLSKFTIPLSIMFVIIIMGFFIPDLEVEKKFEDSINKSIIDTSAEGTAIGKNCYEQVEKIGEITVKNNFFMTRDYQVPEFIACIDERGSLRSMNVFYEEYNVRSLMNVDSNSEIKMDLFLRGYCSYNNETSVDAIYVFERNRTFTGCYSADLDKAIKIELE